MQSTVAATTITLHRVAGTFSRRIAAYIALTNFQRQLMIDGGLSPGKILVIPNFLGRDPGPGLGLRSGVVFVGRLSVEKGVVPLLAAAELERGTVRVAGDGPLRGMVERAAADGHVGYLGPIKPTSVFEELRTATAMVLPSIWFEGFPLVILEAYASGTPVIASRIGGLPELVDDGVTGLLVEPGDPADLGRTIRWAMDHPDEMRQMGANARTLYEARFGGPAHLTALVELYARLSSHETAMAHA